MLPWEQRTRSGVRPLVQRLADRVRAGAVLAIGPRHHGVEFGLAQSHRHWTRRLIGPGPPGNRPERRAREPSSAFLTRRAITSSVIFHAVDLSIGSVDRLRNLFIHVDLAWIASSSGTPCFTAVVWTLHADSGRSTPRM